MNATRRGLFGAGALLAVVPTMAPANPPADAELIAACQAWLRVNRDFDRYCEALGCDIEADDPGWRILDPADALEERIVALQATTPEGIFAKAQCMAFCYLPGHAACKDHADHPAEGRFKAALFRDLTVLEWGERA